MTPKPITEKDFLDIIFCKSILKWRAMMINLIVQYAGAGQECGPSATV
jgi:hypothetical protein